MAMTRSCNDRSWICATDKGYQVDKAQMRKLLSMLMACWKECGRYTRMEDVVASRQRGG